MKEIKIGSVKFHELTIQRFRVAAQLVRGFIIDAPNLYYPELITRAKEIQEVILFHLIDRDLEEMDLYVNEDKLKEAIHAVLGNLCPG